MALLAALFTSSAYSQVLYGSLVGTITDQTGGVIANAAVTATNKDTNQTYKDVTDSGGRFSIANVLPGIYSVKITNPGFRTLVQNDIPVTINNVTRTDLRLEVGQVTDQITVEAQTTQLQTDKSDVHTDLDTKSIENLPLNRYRNYQTLINLVPGSTPASFQNSTTDTPGKALQTHINGANAQDNNTRLDGAQNINIWLPHHVAYVAPADTVETVNVSTDAFDAEQGMAGGAAINVVTKSGTNDLHGTGFAYYDNQHLKARNFFQKAGTDKPFGDTNIDGATIGGRIIKNRLFFFGGWENTRERNGAVLIVSVPTADQRGGDFSKYGVALYDPTTGDPVTGVGRTLFGGGMIPKERITKQAQAVQALLPLPNQGTGTTSNFFAAGTPVLSRAQYDLKINYNRSDKHSIWGKYSLLNANVTAPASLGAAFGAGVGGDPGNGHTFQQLATIGHTLVISPNIVLDGNIGYTRMSQFVKGLDYGKNYGTDVLGIPGTNGGDINQSGFPEFDFNTYASIGQVNTWMPLFRTDESYTHTDNVSWTHGAHEFRFGFDLIRYHLNHFQPELGGGPRGQFNFGGNTTVLGPNGSPNQYNSWASFLIGSATEMQKSYQNILMTGREWQFGWYARDRWQVTRKLTVNIGLRYEFYPLMTRCCGKGLERYDPTTNLIYLGGRGNVPVDDGFSVSHKLFAPRVGFAYRLTEQTVIRAGYGISYDPLPFSRPLRGFYPLTINTDFVGLTSVQPAGSLVTGIPAANFPDLSSGVIQLDPKATERSPWGGEIHRGYIQSWNFSLERRLPGNIVAGAAYVGTETTHNLADREYNTGYPGSGSGANLPLAKFGRTISTLMWDGYLSANYHSLQTSLNKRFASGVMVKAAYTWSKAIDFVDDDGWVTLARNYAPQFNWNRAPAGYDREHVFQAGYVWELPFGKGQHFAGSGPMAWVVGNWQVAGTVSAFTGLPFTATASSASLNAGPNNLQGADQVTTTITQLYNVGPGQYFYDPSSWKPVTDVRFGNSGRNAIRGPGIFNTDLSLSRIFPIKERFRLEFRTDCANLTNTPKFPNPSTSVSTGTFMQITNTLSNNSTAVPVDRQFRFGLRLQF